MSLLWSSQLATVTRQLGRLGVQKAGAKAAAAVQTTSIRSFATKKKKLAKKKKKGPMPSKINLEDTASEQHKEWVKFQQAIAVDGFETGQTKALQNIKKRGGGGSSNKRKTKRDKMLDKIMERNADAELKGGEFPALRYSEEETERLLLQAYAAIPERAGRRGTKNLKRRKRQFALVREIHRKKKVHQAAFQIRRMAARSSKKKDVNTIIREAKSVRLRDREYQLSVIQRWADTMTRDRGGEEEHIDEAELVEESQKKLDV